MDPIPEKPIEADPFQEKLFLKISALEQIVASQQLKFTEKVEEN